MHVPSTLRRSIALLAVFLVVGCHLGPTWDRPIELPTYTGPKAPRVVVAGFRQSSTDVSVTNSSTLRAIRESVRVSDVSASLAQALRARGVNAEARGSNFDPRNLEDDQVLLSGAMLGKGWMSPGRYFFSGVFVWSFSLMTIGGIVPTPVAFRTGLEVEYSLNLQDSEGRIYLQCVSENALAFFDHHYIWPAISDSSKRRALGLLKDVPEIMADQLAPMLLRGHP